MKRIFILISLLACNAHAAVTIGVGGGGGSANAASQAEVDAGTVSNKFVSPATLVGFAAAAGSNGVTTAQLTTYSNHVAGAFVSKSSGGSTNQLLTSAQFADAPRLLNPTNINSSRIAFLNFDGVDATIEGETNVTMAEFGLLAGMVRTPDFSTNFVTTGTSNFVGIATNGTYQFLLMTNDIVIQSQGTGAYSLELDSNGTNRVVSIPTNYFNLSTNGLTSSTTNWQVTIIAGKRAWYSEVARLPNDTNRAWAITVQP